jgi:hypothetical protein
MHNLRRSPQIDRLLKPFEHDIALNTHLRVSCNARYPLIPVIAIDLTPTLKRATLSLGVVDRS